MGDALRSFVRRAVVRVDATWNTRDAWGSSGVIGDGSIIPIFYSGKVDIQNDIMKRRAPRGDIQ